MKERNWVTAMQFLLLVYLREELVSLEQPDDGYDEQAEREERTLDLLNR